MRWGWMFLAAMACGGSAAPAGDGASQGEVHVNSTPSDPTALNDGVDIDVQRFIEIQEAGGATVIDVRTPAEYAEGHVPGAVNVPLDQVHIEQSYIASLDKDAPVYFICAVGGRSKRATTRMAAAGFQAVNVDGGTNGWVAAGKPVDK